MASVKVVDWSNATVGEVELPEGLFGLTVEGRESVLHTVVRWQLNKRRAGTRHAKERHEISFSTKKLYKQKGTGQARRGSRKAPGLRKGGTVHPARQQDFGFALPKKVRRLGLRLALSTKAAQGKIVVVKNTDLPAIKTKAFLKGLDTLGVPGTALIIDDASTNLRLSARNVPGVDVLPTIGVNVYDVLRHDHLILSEAAIGTLRERLDDGADLA